MKKIFAIAIIFALLLNFCTFSFSGWNLIDGEYVYLNSKGQKLQNSWIKSGDNTYYLDENGFITKATLFEYDDDYYFLDADGKRVTNNFAYVGENIKKGDSVKEGLYYFDEHGRAVKKTNSGNFIRNIQGIYYAFDEDGVLAKGWFNKDGDRITDPESFLTDGMYYTDDNGRVYQNRWYNFTDDIGANFYSDQGNGAIANDYDDLDSLWMYFGNNCKKVVSNDSKAKVKEINGKKYAFDDNGIMVEGFTRNGELSLGQLSNPSLTETIKLYSPTDGESLFNKWTKAVPSKTLSQDDFYDDSYNWYYTDGSNNVVYNKLKTIDGKRYIFDGVGKMQTGFGLIDGKGFFVANYKPEDLTRDDFVYSIAEGSHLNGSEMSDLRFFELGDDNGKMLTGNIKIELNDGEYEFYFRESTGVAFGNKHELKKHRDIYYINGLKLASLEDMKYGVVKVSDTEYRVVNQTGKIVKGRKKLVKDDYENLLVILNDKLVAYIIDAHDKVKLKWLKKPIASISNFAGYYYYNSEYEVKDYTALAVAVGTECPTPAQLKMLPTEMRVNFR